MKSGSKPIRIAASTLMAVLVMVIIQFEYVNEAGAERNMIETASLNSNQVERSSREDGASVVANSELKITIEDLRRSMWTGSERGPLSAEQLELAKSTFIVWQENEFGPYEEKLRALEGIDERRVPFIAKVWYCRNESQIQALNGKKLSYDLPEEELFDYVKGGENDDVYCDKNGIPRVWIKVNDERIEDKVKEGFSGAIEWYRAYGMPDILESVTENGMSVYYVADFFPGSSIALTFLDQWGQVSSNVSFNNTKELGKTSFVNISIINLWVESYGIKYLQVQDALKAYLSGDINRGNCEVVKSLIAGYVAQAGRGNDDELISNLAKSFPVAADTFAKDYSEYGVTLDGVETRRLLWLMADFVRIPGFGSLRDVPTFVEAMNKRLIR